MQKAYIAPEWAAAPQNDVFSLDVLKDGSIIENIKLNDLDHFHIGRQQETCEITLEHPSISRLHAVLQFRQDGALMILDMHSTHGTLVNKEKVSSEVYQRLYVGDIIQFGSSTRKYIVCGPESEMVAEYDSANLQAFRQKVAAKNEEIRKKTLTGASWGMGDYPSDEDVEDEDEQEELPDYVKRDPNFDRKYGEKYSSTLRKDEMNERDAELIDKLKTKERKIQNMQEENRRIFLKENSQLDGLTEGQRVAIERNDRRIAVLQDEIEALEAQIRGKNAARAHTSGANVIKRSNKYDFDNTEDVMIDTTQETADASTNWRMRRHAPASTTTAKTTAVSYEELLSQAQALDLEMAHVVENIDDLEKELNSMTDTDDALEIYMQQERRREIEAALDTLRRKHQEIEERKQQNEKYLRIAMPDVDTLKRRRATQSPVPSTINSSTSTATTSCSASDAITSTNVSASSVTNHVTTTPVSDENGESIVGEIAFPCTENIESVPSLNIAASGDFSSSQTSERSLEIDEKDSSRNAGALAHSGDIQESPANLETKGPASASTTESSGGAPEEPPRKKVKGPTASPIMLKPRKIDDDTAVFDSRVLQDGEAVWMPPTNQSGDGRTRLNDKYGY